MTILVSHDVPGKTKWPLLNSRTSFMHSVESAKPGLYIQRDLPNQDHLVFRQERIFLSFSVYFLLRTGKNYFDGSWRFHIQVEGFDYVGLGSATNKKDAETNAAKDFCGFLIGAGIIPADSFPDDLFGEGPTASSTNTLVQQQQQLSTPTAPPPHQFTVMQKSGAPQSTPFPTQKQAPPPMGLPQGSGQVEGWSGAGQRDYHYSLYNKRKFEESINYLSVNDNV
ncbi:ATP-dependent RNA helicase A protein [Acropora cervicornis]|uniref:ATP-dependent RNA helicase A protein n=1 Tax=Acropora cervicornis TaxID=6130 RepID=A0AAD9QTH3_ACRCE|nr:ATP-dependent RNA helicase A protein [Acropora cervicornis]